MYYSTLVCSNTFEYVYYCRKRFTSILPRLLWYTFSPQIQIQKLRRPLPRVRPHSNQGPCPYKEIVQLFQVQRPSRGVYIKNNAIIECREKSAPGMYAMPCRKREMRKEDQV